MSNATASQTKIQQITYNQSSVHCPCPCPTLHTAPAFSSSHITLKHTQKRLWRTRVSKTKQAKIYLLLLALKLTTWDTNYSNWSNLTSPPATTTNPPNHDTPRLTEITGCYKFRQTFYVHLEFMVTRESSRKLVIWRTWPSHHMSSAKRASEVRLFF